MGARLEISGRMVKVKCRQQGLGELFQCRNESGTDTTWYLDCPSRPGDSNGKT
jgi:hypothetical protein